MFFHMKTTLNISEKVMRELKQEAARTGKTMSELVEAALRQALEQRREAPAKITLPSFHGGKPRVDIANRDVMYEIMEGS
jgi:hypothetical protein